MRPGDTASRMEMRDADQDCAGLAQERGSSLPRAISRYSSF